LREIHTAVVHVAAASKPVEEEQLVGPDTPYPLLHVGWHVPPGARLLAHVPRPPLVGAATAHGANVGEGVGEFVMTGVPTSISSLNAFVLGGGTQYEPA
jgi:hypothetical protein